MREVGENKRESRGYKLNETFVGKLGNGKEIVMRASCQQENGIKAGVLDLEGHTLVEVNDNNDNVGVEIISGTGPGHNVEGVSTNSHNKLSYEFAVGSSLGGLHEVVIKQDKAFHKGIKREVGRSGVKGIISQGEAMGRKWRLVTSVD
ncbi:hypothetical protein LIER_02681 [Lithospermum erythrorhizon]|uniref:Uncharacterized protein n=1 Tax=Lithospermum erythrorhizon TaxID=34254 RepID=A0AAV3NQC1_LITER